MKLISDRRIKVGEELVCSYIGNYTVNWTCQILSKNHLSKVVYAFRDLKFQ